MEMVSQFGQPVGSGGQYHGILRTGSATKPRPELLDSGAPLRLRHAAIQATEPDRNKISDCILAGGEEQSVTPPVQKIRSLSPEEREQILGYPEDDRSRQLLRPLRTLQVEDVQHRVVRRRRRAASFQPKDHDRTVLPPREAARHITERVLGAFVKFDSFDVRAGHGIPEQIDQLPGRGRAVADSNEQRETLGALQAAPQDAERFRRRFRQRLRPGICGGSG